MTHGDATLTTTERSLVQALLAHYRMSLVRQLRAPDSPLTADGRRRYEADIALAESAARALDGQQEAAA